jgi:hypothetical protein
MIERQQICKKCILPDGFLGIQLNSEGLCDFCADPNHKNNNYSRTIIDHQKKAAAISDWDKVVALMQRGHNTQRYDCIVGYSGGKDSTALLDYLVNELGVNPLAITINTGFMTAIAKQNIKDTLQKIRVEHRLIEEAVSTFTKLYKYLFLTHNSNEIFLTRTVCDYCSDLLHSIIVQQALHYDVPYILFGYSPDQTFRYFYEIPPEEIIHQWRPALIDQKPFTEEDRKWYLSRDEVSNKKLPRVLFPYHVIPYKEDEIISLVESKHYIQKGHADPLLTNCNVVHAATFYDYNRYGGILYAYQYAELVRQDPQARKKWLWTLKIAAPLILENKFKEKEVNNFLKVIGVSSNQLLAHIHTQLEKDPNQKQIEINKKMFQKRKKI